MTVLVLGSSGQLATHLRELLPDATFCGRTTLDLGEPARVAAAIEALRPSAIVNAAGYTAVDKAESEPALAWRVNAESVAAAALAAAALDVPLVHVSTDYVFDGRKTSPYVEGDPTNPLSVYGATKLAGELAARALCKKSWILRVSWVFSEHGANFVKTMLRLAATRDELRVVADQRGRPTYAGDLATVIAELVRRAASDARLPFGTYHAVGGQAVSWHEFAERIVEQAFTRGMIAKRVPVRAITTEEYPTPARRPANSVLEPSRELERTLGVAIDWSAGLATALAALRT
ncbi:MAG TPA: dTDP-4-dehydrorhamnose reductase [Gammaproteobacteria bacterium]